MTTNTMRGLLVATAAAAMLAVIPAHAADAPTPKLSSGVAKQLLAVQNADKAKDIAAAKAAIAAAKEVSGRTPYDDYMITRFELSIAAQTNDMTAAAPLAMAMADSPAQPEAEKQANLKNATQLSLIAKMNDKAVEYAKRYAATNPTDKNAPTIIGQAFYFGGDYADAIAYNQKVVDADLAAHQRPDRNTLELIMNSQVKMKDEAGAEKTLETLVAQYNDPSDWTQMIDVTMGTKGLRDLDAIWLGRLLFLSGANVSASDANLIGSTASHLTFFGDAQVAQQHGGTGFPDANASANKDKATIQAQIAAAPKANGLYNVKLAEALYSYGMYPEAESAARAAMQKGGVPDTSEAPMVLGQSLAAQGKYDDAIAAFGQVTGGGPATPRIARLWIDYANIKKNPPAPVAAAAK